MRKRVFLLVTMAALLGGAACSAADDHKADAAITACTPGPDNGKPVASGQVTNSSSKTSNYSIRIGFYDASGNKITDGLDAVTGVEAGSSSPWSVTGLKSMNGAVDCRVAGVTRNVVPGG